MSLERDYLKVKLIYMLLQKPQYILFLITFADLFLKVLLIFFFLLLLLLNVAQKRFVGDKFRAWVSCLGESHVICVLFRSSCQSS